MSKPDKEEKFTCEKCGAIFADAPALERHKQIHEHSKREEEAEKELQQGTHQPTVKPDLGGNPPGGGPPKMPAPTIAAMPVATASQNPSSRRSDMS